MSESVTHYCNTNYRSMRRKKVRGKEIYRQRTACHITLRTRTLKKLMRWCTPLLKKVTCKKCKESEAYQERVAEVMAYKMRA